MMGRFCSQFGFIRLLFLLVILGFTLITAKAQTVEISDANLKAAIWQALGKQPPPGVLTVTDMQSLTNLDASYSGIRSIEGLQYARNLTSLNLSGNLLTDVSLPSELINLNVLDLGTNQLSTLSFPGGLTGLTYLNLGHNY